MKYLFTAIFFISALCVFAQSVNYADLERRSFILYEKGAAKPYTGKAIGLHKNGKVEKEVGYKDGKLDGEYKEWYKTGKAKYQGFYKENKLHGKFRYWHKNGNPERTGEFKNNVKDGIFVTWHKNRQKESSGTYVNGNKEGEWTEWYEDGSISSKGTYKNGLKTGFWTENYENGMKYCEGTYNNGVEGKDFKYWDEKGTPIKNPGSQGNGNFNEMYNNQGGDVILIDQGD